MAASMGIFVGRNFLRKTCHKHRLYPCRYKATAANVSPRKEDSANVHYPPVKPRFPPGKWGGMSEKFAWRHYEEAMAMNNIPKVKERLDKMAELVKLDDKKQIIWQVQSFPLATRSLKYHQYLTKTSVVNGLPDVYSNQQNVDDITYQNIRSACMQAITQESSFQLKHRANNTESEGTQRMQNAHRVVGHVVNALMCHLSLGRDYLLWAQLDEDVRVETFWKRCGYGSEDHRTRGLTMGDELMMQYLHRSNYQIRTEHPLRPFVPETDKLCVESEYPSDYNYGPETFGLRHGKARPITMSGHWVGDPCEFHLASFNVLDERYDAFVERHGQDSENTQEKILEHGLLTAFGSCVSQAHNQGFSLHWDVTYPFSTQSVVTDGQRFQFVSYQLNTLQLWKDEAANPRRNIAWVSPLMKLYETVEGGEVREVNDDVLKQLVKFVTLAPTDRGVDLRPYLPEEAAPGKTKLYINYKGDEPIEHPKIPRYYYPRYSLYF